MQENLEKTRERARERANEKEGVVYGCFDARCRFFCRPVCGVVG